MLRTLDGVDVAGKRVIVRADLNVPMKNGEVADHSRIHHASSTLVELADRGAIVIVLSHYDRPNGRVVPEMSIAPVSSALERSAKRPVRFVATDWIGGSHGAAVSSAKPGDILLMENTRFHPGEERNDTQFAHALAGLGDIYVNDAFSVAHRAHASTEGIARLLPSFAGRGMEAELTALELALGAPSRPVGAVVGGSKVSTKIAVLENLAGQVDMMVIGGAMANTFLHARGIAIGRSLREPGLTDVVKRIEKRAQASGCEIALPRDAVVATMLAAGTPTQTAPVSGIPADSMILDCGPQTMADIASRFGHLRTLLWNGPVGAFEIDPFGTGTFALARAAARMTNAGNLITVAGGGDTVAALAAAGVSDDFTYVSMAGGAFLEWLEGRELPGVVPLKTTHN